MSNHIECPYCGEEQQIDHDGYGYDKGIHRQECTGCGKSFAYETTISIFHKAFAASCIDGDVEHDWKETKSIPRCYRKLRCSVCGEEKEIEGRTGDLKTKLPEGSKEARTFYFDKYADLSLDDGINIKTRKQNATRTFK